MTIWTVSEVMAELSLLPPDAPVIIATECGEEEDMLFWFDPCEDAEGNKALLIRVDLREQNREDDTPNVKLSASARTES